MIRGRPVNKGEESRQSARGAVVTVLAQAAERWPDVGPGEARLRELVAPMSGADRALARAIYRTVVQRWITLEFVLDQFLSQSMRRLEPMMRAVLLSGAAQMLFMDKLPGYAVVNESVALAKRLIRPGAGAMTNAVLRKLTDIDWRSRLPAKEQSAQYLSIATSHPVGLIEAWIARFGWDEAERLAEHSNVQPPVLVRCDVSAECAAYQLYERAGFMVWMGDHEALMDFLRAAPDRWVQDPTAGAVVEAMRTQDLQPNVIVDYCAGKGTKTRQLAAAYPQATIIATDTDAERYEELRRTFAGHPHVRVTPMSKMREHEGRADVVLLDVPCSNTGVLPRRPEARYRYSPKSIDGLLHLQRTIIQNARELLSENGVLAYSTCSIDERENQGQSRWIGKHLQMKLIAEGEHLPAGEGRTYHDGGYWAMLR